MNAVISIALPVFSVIAVGIIAGKMRILSSTDTGALNRFVFNFAMPAALFNLTVNAAPLSTIHFKLASAYGVASLMTISITYWISKKLFSLNKQEAGAHAFASTLGNAVFLGLPIALSIPHWAENFVVLMLIEGTLIISIAAALMSPGTQNSKLDLLIKPLRNPLVFAMIAGFIISIFLRAFDLTLPESIITFLNILGHAAGPTALFSMGLFLATSAESTISKVTGRIATIFTAKMVALPVVTIAILKFIDIDDPSIIGPAALFTLVPTGIGTYIMASQYKVYVTEVAAAIAFTTMVSIFTISALLAIMVNL